MAASFACTTAARRTVWTAARAASSRSWSVLGPLSVRAAQTCSARGLSVDPSCDMPYPFAV
jgi:hypothetical protein